MADSVWYPDGIPLVFLTMHNVKDTVATDSLLSNMLKGGVSDRYLYFKEKYYENSTTLRAAADLQRVPCLLV